MDNEISFLETEQRNNRTKNLSNSSTLKIVEMINHEDQLVPKLVLKEKHEIAKVIDLAYEQLKHYQGRIIYMGAGTSGRIGVLDATEIWPTFGVKDRIIGLIAGGLKAIYSAIEGAEDDEKQAINDLKAINFNQNDILIGIAASGRTPYVISGLKYAKSLQAKTAFITNAKAKIDHKYLDGLITVITGAEAITGSTRMKAGTAQKLICNMISSSVMIKLGYVESNYMINLVPSNYKLEKRCKNIIYNITKADQSIIDNYFNQTRNVKMTLIMIQHNVSKIKAEKIYKELYGYN